MDTTVTKSKILKLKLQQKQIDKQIKKYHVEIEKKEIELKNFSKTFFYKIWIFINYIKKLIVK